MNERALNRKAGRGRRNRSTETLNALIAAGKAIKRAISGKETSDQRQCSFAQGGKLLSTGVKGRIYQTQEYASGKRTKSAVQPTSAVIQGVTGHHLSLLGQTEMPIRSSTGRVVPNRFLVMHRGAKRLGLKAACCHMDYESQSGNSSKRCWRMASSQKLSLPLGALQ